MEALLLAYLLSGVAGIRKRMVVARGRCKTHEYVGRETYNDHDTN
jgi:hypothetical protein